MENLSNVSLADLFALWKNPAFLSAEQLSEVKNEIEDRIENINFKL